jgi:pimeloyl-ACP methyl ester carboxylesterase
MSVFAFYPGLARFARDVVVMVEESLLRIHVYDTATEAPDGKPAIVLVHGLNDDADTWRHVIGPLSETHRVVALDLPGFGRSYKPSRNYSLPFFRETVAAVMDALEIERATLIGNSMGAMIAQAFSLAWPERVERLVLVCGALILRQQPLNWSFVRRALPFFQRKVEDKSANFRRDPQAAYALLRPYYADFDGLPADDRTFLLSRVRDRVWDDNQFYAYQSVWQQLPVWFLVNRRDLRDQISASPVPTVVAWGEQDKIFSLEHAEAQLEANPSIDLRMIARAGHLPQQERPAEWLTAVGYEQAAWATGEPASMGDA